MPETPDTLPLHCRRFPEDLAEAYHVEEEARNTVVTLLHMGTPWKMRVIGFAPCPNGFALNAAVVMLPPQGIPTLRSRKEVEKALGRPLAFQSEYTAVQEAIERGTTADQANMLISMTQERIMRIGKRAWEKLSGLFGRPTSQVSTGLTDTLQEKSKDSCEALI